PGRAAVAVDRLVTALQEAPHLLPVTDLRPHHHGGEGTVVHPFVTSGADGRERGGADVGEGIERGKLQLHIAPEIELRKLDQWNRRSRDRYIRHQGKRDVRQVEELYALRGVGTGRLA